MTEPSTPRVPLTVKHDDLLEALAPLCALLGITSNDIYASPPLTVGGPVGEGNLGYVTFSVPAASGLPVGEAHPQGPDAHGEWRHFIEVEVLP